MFRKRNSYLDSSSRATSTQMIVNENPEHYKAEEKDSETDSEKESIHSNWSELLPVEVNKHAKVVTNDASQRKRTVRNVILVPYKPKPKDWGTWKIKSPYTTSTIVSPSLDDNNDQNKNSDQDKMNKRLIYVPHSPYYELVHSSQFYGDE